jgi:choline dehydrogenase-like flavoprotein
VIIFGFSYHAVANRKIFQVQSFDQVLRHPEIIQPLLEMYAKDGSGPLGEYFSPTAYLPLLETLGPEGKNFLSQLLASVSPKDLPPLEKRTEKINLEMLSRTEVSAGQFFLEKLQFNVKGNSKVSDIVSPKSPGDYFTFIASLSHPFSQGTVHINSINPMNQPTIDPKYLSHPMDLEMLARLVQFIPILTSTKPISTFLKPDGRRIPTDAFTAEQPVPTIEKAKQLVRDTLFSNYHLAGTCRMANKENGGVVNKSLIVHGVKNLRVVDASIFPLMPMGNIITSVYAIAERAADLIKEDWTTEK